MTTVGRPATTGTGPRRRSLLGADVPAATSLGQEVVLAPFRHGFSRGARREVGTNTSFNAHSDWSYVGGYGAVTRHNAGVQKRHRND